ncbi:MAG TPA: hypothetical protein VG370_24240 [Chloroflexota bacterium]|nr:hypothetical protein [Chloroflexota bacterium]
MEGGTEGLKTATTTTRSQRLLNRISTGPCYREDYPSRETIRLLKTAPNPCVHAATVEADELTEADRWLILTLLAADPIELPTDVPDLSPLLAGLEAAESA